jgi:multiple sugar transport system ATP-binding protein
VDVLESMGSDEFAYFSVEGEQAVSEDRVDLAADAGTAAVQGADVGRIVARLSAASGAAEGQSIRSGRTPRGSRCSTPRAGGT